MKISFFIIILIISTNVFASQTVMVNTKFGYLTDDKGHIVGKYSDYNKGPLVIPDGYIYTEVTDQTALNNIVLYKSPEQQQSDLNNQALQEVIANQIANDPKLSAQQATITKSLNALQAQTK